MAELWLKDLFPSEIFNMLYQENVHDDNHADVHDDVHDVVHDVVHNVVSSGRVMRDLFRCHKIREYFTPSQSGDPPYKKCKEKFLRKKERGNKLYQAGKLSEAVTEFSNALALADTERDVAIALANRSLCFTKLSSPDLAVKDIELALNQDYPQELRYKLHERQAKCLMMLGRLDEAKQAVVTAVDLLAVAKLEQSCRDKVVNNCKTLLCQINSALSGRVNGKLLETDNNNNNSNGNSSLTEGNNNDGAIDNKNMKENVSIPHVNSLVPAFSSGVEIRFDPVRGRHGVATRDLHVGEIVLQEQPIAAAVRTNLQCDYCCHCFLPVIPRSLPCSSCSQVRFCGEECARLGVSSHQLACTQATWPWEQALSEFPGVMPHYNVIIKIFGKFPVSYFMDRRELFTKPNTRAGSVDADTVFNPEVPESLFQLVSHSSEIEAERLLPLLYSSCCILRRLQLKGYFQSSHSTIRNALSPEEEFIGGIIFQFHQAMLFNTHAIVETLLESQDYPRLLDIRSTGCGVYPSLCLLNTSCDQNITKYNTGTTVVAVVCKPIRRGEEVTDNYYPTALVMPKQERQAWLAVNFKFTCSCTACVRDIPLMKDMDTRIQNIRCPHCKEIISANSGECPECGEGFILNKIQDEVTGIEQGLKEIECLKEGWRPQDYLHHSLRLYSRLCDLLALPSLTLARGQHIYLKALRQQLGNHRFLKTRVSY